MRPVLVAAVVWMACQAPAAAQPASQPSEAHDDEAFSADLSEDGDASGRAGGTLAFGVGMVACGAGLGACGALVPLVSTVVSAVLWDRHAFSGHGANVELPAGGQVNAPAFELLGFRFAGVFALMMFTVVPVTAAVLLGGAVFLRGLASVGSGVAALVDTWVGHEVPDADWRTQQRTVEPFSRVRVEGGAFKIIVRQGPAASVRVRAPAQSIESVNTSVTSGVLRVSSGGRFRMRQRAEVEVVTPSVEWVELAGLGHLQVQGVSGDALRVVVSGAGKVEVDARVRLLEVEIVGAGLADVAGQAQVLRAAVTGTGALQAGGLQTQDAHVEVSGAGSATVAPADLLDASISGVGRITYRGQPKTIRQQVGGLGRVVQESSP